MRAYEEEAMDGEEERFTQSKHSELCLLRVVDTEILAYHFFRIKI